MSCRLLRRRWYHFPLAPPVEEITPLISGVSHVVAYDIDWVGETMCICVYIYILYMVPKIGVPALNHPF